MNIKRKLSKKQSEIDISEIISSYPAIKSSGIVIGVSGGKDSITLLDCISKVLPKDKIFVVHINHGFRKESNEDATFVRKLAKKYDVRFFSKKLKKPKSENLENFGRKERYIFFNEILSTTGASFIATAHTANDVAETLLMQLFSNKRISGISVFDPKRKLLRPFLSVTRKQIDEYVFKNKLIWKEDETNKDTQRLRNKIRHITIPHLITHFGDEILGILIEQGSFMHEYESAIELVLNKQAELLSSHVFGSKEWLRCLKKILSDLPQVLGEKLLEEVFLVKLRYRLGKLHRKRLYAFITGSSLQVELTAGLIVRRKASGITIKIP